MKHQIGYGLVVCWMAVLPAMAQAPASQPVQSPQALPAQTSPSRTSPEQQTPPAQQTPQSSKSQSADRLDKGDSTWAAKVAQGGLAEVKFGQLAASKGTSQDVKDFGQKMVDDHGKANDELKSIASKKGITLPADLAAKDQTAYDNLSKVSGAAFDKAYLANMVKDHKADIAEFKKEASTGTDTDLKDFASKTLPTLENHLSMAEKAQSSLGKSK